MRRVLLDENPPRLLRRELPESDTQTVPEAGWAGMKNGALLRLAQTRFDVFLTADRNLSHQQSVIGLDLGVVVIAARSTKLDDLTPPAAEIRAAITEVGVGEVRTAPAA